MSDDPIPALKQQVAATIVRVVDLFCAWDAAYRMRTDQPRVADLRRGRLKRFSLQQLLRFAHRLGIGIEVRLTPPVRRTQCGFAARGKRSGVGPPEA